MSRSAPRWQRRLAELLANRAVTAVFIVGFAILAATVVLWLLALAVTGVAVLDLRTGRTFATAVQAVSTVLLVAVTVVYVRVVGRMAKDARDAEARRREDAESQRQRRALTQVWSACRQAPDIIVNPPGELTEALGYIATVDDEQLPAAHKMAADWDDQTAIFEEALLEAAPEVPEPFRNRVHDIAMVQIPLISHTLWVRAGVRSFGEGEDAQRFRERTEGDRTVHGLVLDGPWRRLGPEVRSLQKDLAEHLIPLIPSPPNEHS